MAKTLFTVLVIGTLPLGWGCATTGTSRLAESASGITEHKPEKVRIAGIVRKWIIKDKQQNYERVEPLIRQAAAEGAEIVVTTESFLDGYAIRDKQMPLEEYRLLGEPIPGGDYFARLQVLADELDIYLVAGLLEREGTTMYNSAVLIDPEGRLVGKYRKQFLMHEAVRNTPGHEFPAFDTRFGKIGLIICADRRWPHLVKNIVDNGAELVICVSGGTWGPKSNDPILRARSRENHVPIIFVHPIQWLVTDSAGEILDNRFALPPEGRPQSLDVALDRIDTPDDAWMIAMIDLPLCDRVGDQSTNKKAD